jgi:23S rRNA (cytidine2498-2'-O)-methyltransferase
MPREAPSRSTLKLAEAIAVFLGDRERELMHEGQSAVDLGAAPGGWTWQLVARGLHATAVDNGALAPALARHPNVEHVRADGLAWRPRRPVDWLVCDMVEKPSRIAALVADWVATGAASRAIFNLKLPMKKRDDEVQRAAATIRDRLAASGVDATLALRQLYHDREEVTGYLARAHSSERIPRRR